MKTPLLTKTFKKVISISTFFILMLSFGILPAAYASVPTVMSYQGLLKDSSGNFLTGTYSMVFRIYTASSGGTAVWTETQSSVSASSGKFSVSLGSVTALNLSFNADYWLSVQVGADAEMSPRIKLTATGYAYMAENVVNSFTQAQHDALSHKNVEGVKDNTVSIGKTNFKLDAYSSAVANSMGDMLIDTFTDASGISSGSSSDYTWRGSSNFDVIASPGGIDSNAKLMLHGNGTDASTTFTDSSSGAKTMTANGNAQIDTAQTKFGSASMLFDGSGDYVSNLNSSDFQFGTGDFTVDFWVRFNTHTGNSTLFITDSTGSGNQFSIGFLSSTNKLRVYLRGVEYDRSWTPSNGVWYHIAVTRNSTDLKIFIDGTQQGVTETNSTNLNVTDDALFGGDNGGWLGYLDGWIDEARVSKGTARWTSNFTVPSAEYSSSSGTATVISVAYTEASAPTEAIVMADETLGSGSITYYVSRDNGTTWTACTKETVTSISSQPSGTQLKWKAVITGNAELNAIGVAV